MRKRATSFVLIAAMIGSALAGVHAPAVEHHCPMAGMDMSDCCDKAHEQSESPAVSAARLCCALNCTEPGTTNPTGAFKISPSGASALYAGATPPIAAATLPHPALSHPYTSSGPPAYSSPAYIRHLALLI